MDKNIMPGNSSSDPLDAGSTGIPNLHTNPAEASSSNPQFIGMPTRSTLGSTHANSTVPNYASPASTVPSYKPEEISKPVSSIIPPAQRASSVYTAPTVATAASSAPTPVPKYTPATSSIPENLPHVTVAFEEKPKAVPEQPAYAAPIITPVASASAPKPASSYAAPASSHSTPSSAYGTASSSYSATSYGTPTPAYTAAQKAALEAAASAASLNAAAADASVASQSHPMKNIWIAVITLVVFLLLGGAFAYYYFIGTSSGITMPVPVNQAGQNSGSSFPAGVRPSTTTPAATNPSGAFSKSNRDLISDYIRANINTLSPRKATPAFAVTSISFDGPDRALVDYTNGRVSHTAAAVATVDSAGKVRVTSFIILEK
ncbi:MAG TPA: hypothetical protein VGE62_00705 [Candidatus Paceibacterota bacterium]